MLEPTQVQSTARGDWRRFVKLFLGIFVGGILGAALFILLLDPYDMVPFSLPIERPLVSGSQRFAYPQAMRSKRFDSIIVGSSTARLIDPEQLNGPFGARLANMAMNASTAWEEWTTFEYFRRHAGAPKVLIIGIDDAWCDPNAERERVRHGFPEWMYDDDTWNDYANLFNSGTLAEAKLIAIAALASALIPSAHEMKDRLLRPMPVVAVATALLAAFCVFEVGKGAPVNFIYFQF